MLRMLINGLERTVLPTVASYSHKRNENSTLSFVRLLDHRRNRPNAGTTDADLYQAEKPSR